MRRGPLFPFLVADGPAPLSLRVKWRSLTGRNCRPPRDLPSGLVSPSNTNPLPFAVREALIQACGTVFHWKRGLIQLFVSAGVPEPAVTRYRDEVKYVIARSVLADLDDRGVAGRRVQWQVVDNMLGLSGPADRDADPAAAKTALQALREAVGQRSGAQADADDAGTRSRKRRAELERQARERQSQAIAALRTRFFELESERDRRSGGSLLSAS